MDRNDDRISTEGHPENTGRDLNMQPGRLREIENATAYANRIDPGDVTGATPERMGEGERLHDREDMSGREGMAGETAGNPLERGQRQAQTGGGGAHRVTPGEDLGNGMRAKPADGLEGADGRVHRGEDIGSGMHAKPADRLEDADGRVQHGEDIGNGIRARRADEQSPGNPLV